MRRPNETGANAPSVKHSRKFPDPRDNQSQDLPPLALARLLDKSLMALLAVVVSLAHPSSPGASPPYDAALHAAQIGQAEASSCEREATAEAMRATPETLESPLSRLAHAYRRAFDALGAACLLLGDDTVPLPPAAEPLVERASQAARQLVKVTDLIYNERGLGSTEHLCAYISELENQADVMYRGAVNALFGLKAAERVGSSTGSSRRGRGVWTPEHTRRFHLLNALESLTDRCEEIASELLLLEYTMA